MSGKHKGNSWERNLAVHISLWWTKGVRDDVFYRSQNSGGRATARGKVGKKADLHCGDIAASDSEGEPLVKTLIFEAKKGYDDVTIHSIIDGKKQSELILWFEKAETDMRRAGAYYWAVIHRRDYREPLLYVPCSLVWKLEMLGVSFEEIDHYILNVKGSVKELNGEPNGCEQHEVQVFRFDDFLTCVSPEIIRKLFEQVESERASKYTLDIEGEVSYVREIAS